VENCVIENWTAGSPGPGIGIKFAPPDGVTAKLHIKDSVIKNNGLPASGGGVIVQPSGSGSAKVVIERTTIENNTYGFFANGTGSTGNIIVHLKDSVVSNSAFGGVSAYTLAGQSVVSLTMDRSSSLLNGADGILSQSPNAYVLLAGSTVLSNVTGLHSANVPGEQAVIRLAFDSVRIRGESYELHQTTGIEGVIATDILQIVYLRQIWRHAPKGDNSPRSRFRDSGERGNVDAAVAISTGQRAQQPVPDRSRRSLDEIHAAHVEIAEAIIARDGALARHRMMTYLEDVSATAARRPPARAPQAEPTAAGTVSAAG
jgi:hypothetical protein